MRLHDAKDLPLWEHASASGRFTEYAGTTSDLRPWGLLGRAMLACMSAVGSGADFVTMSRLSSASTAGRVMVEEPDLQTAKAVAPLVPAMQSVAASQGAAGF